MQFYKSDKQRFLIGLVLIVLIYSVYYLNFMDNTEYDPFLIPRKIRHVIKFVTTIIVYIIGSSHLGKLNEQWMATLWHIVHISLLVTITLIGLYDWTFGMVSISTKLLAASMQEFLISPIFYAGMGILNSKFGNNKLPVL